MATLKDITLQNAETAAATANQCSPAGRGTIEDVEKKLQAQNVLISEAIDTMRAKVKKEEAMPIADEAGLSAVEKSMLKRQEKVEERAEERAKKIDDTTSMRWRRKERSNRLVERPF